LKKRPEMDPITFEVIRHRLWQITSEMGAALIHISGSPVVTQVNDIMTGLFLADGDPVTFGPFVVLHFGCNPFAIKAIIRDCTDEIGIEPDDMFIVNDPWCGAAHQNDVVIAAPLHHKGELIGWSACMAHQLDVGAMTPGGFTAGATEVYQEGIRFPPTKLVDRGKLRKDVFNVFLNNVMVPEVALDLKGEIAANNVARKRIYEMIEEFGIEKVKQTMHTLIDFSEAKFRSRLREFPDGEFTHLDRIDHDGHSKKVYEVRLKMTKKGDSLTFDFTGSSPQANGVVNAALPATYGGVMGAVGPWLCHDIPWNKGIQRPITVIAEPGTVVNAQKPAPVSTASVEASWVVKTCAQACLSKLLVSSAKYHDSAQAAWQGGVPILIISGRDQYRRLFTDYLMDIVSGGTGARGYGDGLNACWDSNAATLGLPNIETHESRDPILFLFRRFVPNSGGAGKYRGGTSCEDMFVPYDTDRLSLNVCAHGVQMPSNTGIFGGYPGSRNQVFVKRGTNVRELFARGVIPDSIDQISGETEQLEAKPPYFSIGERDLILYRWAGGGEYGDPLERQPELVAADVRRGLVTRDFAAKVYGVIVDAHCAVGREETQETRAKITGRRSPSAVTGKSVPAPESETSKSVRIGEYLERWDVESKIRCSKCGHVYCNADQDPLDHATVARVPTLELGPLFGEAGSDYVFYEAYCPACGVRFYSSVMERGRAVGTDIKLS
jgi:N-methylhydantoinase B